jgi:HTH-type transcriptional regulator/antitoxin MqsA
MLRDPDACDARCDPDARCKKLDLDQREAGEIFGGGVNAFSRYENGKTKPSLALVKLLKVLDRHPDLLDEIREIE